MRIPSPKTASDRLLVIGAYHITALGTTPELTGGLVPGFQLTQDELRVAMRAREDVEYAAVVPRVLARFAEYALEQTLRQLGLAAHALDNNMHTGAAFKAVFPSGTDAAIRPRGAAQVAAALEVAKLLATRPAAEPLRAEYAAKLDAGIGALKGRIEDRKTSAVAVGAAQAVEMGLRETWVATYDSHAGAIRELFPKQTARQDLYFDVIDSGRPAATDDGEAPQPPV